MSYLRIILAGFLSVALAGCASTYTRETVVASQVKLAPSGSVLIAVPQDGSYGGQGYPASGAATADVVRAAFSRYSNNVKLEAGCSEIGCLTANSAPFDYYVVPLILHWEDRATEWSGKPDRVEVKITVYDRSGKVLASQVISGKSKWATFGGDHPQDLLPESINPYVGSLY